MYGDLDWPLSASREFVSISWASCSSCMHSWPRAWGLHILRPTEICQISGHCCRRLVSLGYLCRIIWPPRRLRCLPCAALFIFADRARDDRVQSGGVDAESWNGVVCGSNVERFARWPQCDIGRTRECSSDKTISGRHYADGGRAVSYSGDRTIQTWPASYWESCDDRIFSASCKSLHVLSTKYTFVQRLPAYFASSFILRCCFVLDRYK